MIQDIAPHVYHNQYKYIEPEKDNYVLCFKNRRALVKKEGEKIDFLKFEEVEVENPIYLFAIDDQRFYLAEDLKYDGPCEWIKKEEFRTVKPDHLAFAGITAFQLHGWYFSHRFCGACGSPMKHDEKERMVKCTSCGQMEYPKICPAVIVGVTDGDRLLLTKYAGRAHTNYALIAGFAEIGESIEDTVRREVMEEVGLEVKNIRFYKSQPWSFTDTLLMGFYCEVDGLKEITLDEDELAVAEWFEREEIPVHQKTVSLTNEMILNFKAGNWKY